MLKRIFKLLTGFAISIAFHSLLTGGLFLYYELVTWHTRFQISEFRGSFFKCNAAALAGAMLILIVLLLFRQNRLNQILVRDIPSLLSLVNLVSLMTISTISIFADQNLPLSIHWFILATLVVYFAVNIHKGFRLFKDRSSAFLKDQNGGRPIIDIREILLQNRQNMLWALGIITSLILIPLISKKTDVLNENKLFLGLYVMTLPIVVFELSWLSTALLTFLVHRQFSVEDRRKLDFDGQI